MFEGLLNEDKDLEMKFMLKREICFVKWFWEIRWIVRFDIVLLFLVSYKFEYVVLVKIENISISDVKINVSGYCCYFEDLEFIVVVVLVYYLFSFFKLLVLFF